MGKKIGIIGLGTIGSYLKERIESSDKFELAFILDVDKTKATVSSLDKTNLSKIDLVVECASAEAVKEYAAKVLEKTDLMILSSSALAEKNLEEKISVARKKFGTKLFIPSGAIIGLDGIVAVKEQLESVELVTRKNPKGFGRNDKKETVLFEGNARKAAMLYPKNVNVAATLALNGIGFEKTKAKIISDPKCTANTHTVTAKGKFGAFHIKVAALPSKNPKTSGIAALSAWRKINEILLGRSLD